MNERVLSSVSSACPKVRAEAVRVEEHSHEQRDRCKLQTRESVASLIQMLQQCSSQSRQAAVECLTSDAVVGPMSAEEFVGLVVQPVLLLLQHSDLDVRQAAAQVISNAVHGYCAAEVLVEQVVLILERHNSPICRQAAVQ